MGRVTMTVSTSSGMLMIRALLILTATMAVVEGGRDLKKADNPGGEDKALHPDNFFGGFGAGGLFPNPGNGLGIGTGTGVGAGFGTGPGAGVGFGSGPGLGSSVDFCSVPGLGCVRVQPTNPGAGAGTGAGGLGSNTPLPFP